MADNSFGLSPDDLEAIIAILRKFPQIERALIFGSRAKATHKPGSDVDIVLKGNIGDIVSQVSFLLNEDSLLPYRFDVLDFGSILNQSLVDHINRVGIVFYERGR